MVWLDPSNKRRLDKTKHGCFHDVTVVRQRGPEVPYWGETSGNGCLVCRCVSHCGISIKVNLS